MSFEWLLTLVGAEADSATQEWLLKRLTTTPTWSIPGCAKAILRRLTSNSSASSNLAVVLLCECLDRASSDAASLRLSKNVMFGNAAIVTLTSDPLALTNLPGEYLLKVVTVSLCSLHFACRSNQINQVLGPI
jgi:hypothetical protein